VLLMLFVLYRAQYRPSRRELEVQLLYSLYVCVCVKYYNNSAVVFVLVSRVIYLPLCTVV